MGSVQRPAASGQQPVIRLGSGLGLGVGVVGLEGLDAEEIVDLGVDRPEVS